MTAWKRALRFTLCLLPVAAAAAYVTALYSLSGLDPALVDAAVAQMGSRTALLLVSTLQSIVYAVVCGFFGYILAEKLGLMRPWRPERLPLRTRCSAWTAGPSAAGSRRSGARTTALTPWAGWRPSCTAASSRRS